MGVTRIADSVHGTVVLDEHEGAVISSRAFQRLRGVKHLGLAGLVFPGADYSRFAHGVGTLHVTSLILSNLQTNVPDALTPEEIRLYRMSALLHDIGHYPFSHTFERALKNFYSETQILRKAGTDEAAEAPASEIWLHEAMGKRVLLDDQEVNDLLEKAGMDPREVANIIERIDPPRYANLVSSDLDADRTDYLMRTAKHTGLPYGNVDLPYLLSQIRLDRDDQICFTQKGMRAAEHLLLSRYFDYQQVSYHKTVAGLELVLNDAVGVMLRRGKLDCSSSALQEMIADGRWYGFDDAHVLELMRHDYLSGDLETADKQLLQAILERRPPKLVAERERLGPENSHGEVFRGLEHSARARIAGWQEQFGVPFYLWSQDGRSLTKIASTVQVSALNDMDDDETFDKVQQSVKILMPDGSSKAIQDYPRSLISILSNQYVYGLRVYALLPQEKEDLRAAIEERVNSDLGSYWKDD